MSPRVDGKEDLIHLELGLEGNLGNTGLGLSNFSKQKAESSVQEMGICMPGIKPSVSPRVGERTFMVLIGERSFITICCFWFPGSLTLSFNSAKIQ